MVRAACSLLPKGPLVAVFSGTKGQHLHVVEGRRTAEPIIMKCLS